MTALFALMMSLVLTACSAVPPVASVYAAPSPARTPEEARAAEPAEAADGAPVRYVVDTDVSSDSAAAEDGTPLVSCRFALPVMTVVREDGSSLETGETPEEIRALEIAEAFNARFAEWAASPEFEGLTEEARELLDWQRQEGIPWFGGYTLELTCEIYQTDTLVSVLGTYYSNTGGAHPNTWQLGWTFDLLQGTFLEPELLSEGTELLDAVSEEILRQADAPGENGRALSEDYWEDREAIIANWYSYAVSFDAGGMTVTFSPYELAPYAMGAQCFHLPYDFLAPCLSDYGRMLLGIEAPPEIP